MKKNKEEKISLQNRKKEIIILIISIVILLIFICAFPPIIYIVIIGWFIYEYFYFRFVLKYINYTIRISYDSALLIKAQLRIHLIFYSLYKSIKIVRL